jgi:hypothetical protein
LGLLNINPIYDLNLDRYCKSFGKNICIDTYDFRGGMLVMNVRLLGIAASVLLTLLPTSALAQSINTLNAQLKQAVASNNWNQAIQIVNKMIVAEPGQAARLETYKAELQQRLNPTSKILPSSSTSPKTSAPSSATGTGKVTVTNAFVSRNEQTKGSVDSAGTFIQPKVTYDLTGDIYNGTNGTIRLVTVYYDILSWNKDNNKSGSFTIPKIQARRKFSFAESLQWQAESLDSKNQYEGVKVRINKVEWFNEDATSGSNDTRRLFGYWGKT